MFDFKEVNSKGIDCGVYSVSVDKSTTIGDICAKFDSKHKQVVRMKDGLIHGIVASGTKAVKLIDDGCTYRLDLYPTSRLLSDENTFHVCVKFIGNSPAERLQTPLLVKVKNGKTLNAIGLHLVDILGILNVAVVRNFQYFIDDKYVQNDSMLFEPESPESIQVVSLNMYQSKKPKPTFSYRNPMSNSYKK